ncbi:monovalent cation/H(+) antiporter subunit G [Vibrio hangzhouensis]|uniref:Multisubunit sodium/proton antiporter, MrpG subunit (TC 2.A.63.1) n=1 Tax=Vibrio hangzhouensis TaxID=462991 RepID=A0A1H5XVA3_9VIBR|nr:monovalent cation/H(+) antiporter subunit G [Vibrio hangzhouensis]SEG15709.1 multisubunit sodium/proton antiporter, MrpG subunit (TC 2.A.63.1) [Vibrio hangzhouensis]
MEILTGILLCLGTFFVVVASLGVLRMPDLYTRMHASTKANTMGLTALLAAVAMGIPDVSVVSRVLGTMLFILLTAPVATHLLGKSMHANGYKMWRRKK